MASPSQRFVLAISLLWAALGALSLVGFEAPEFRAWEQLYEADAHRFAPARHVAMREIGDLGYKTWNRSLQAPREIAFTTDRWGYRNASDLAAPDVVVIGDSYVAGAGLSDDETVSARLAQHLGVPVYNFAGENLNAPALFLREARFAQQPPRVVIWAPVARGIAARPLIYEGSPDEAAPIARARGHVASWGRSLAEAVERLNRDNGLVREARFAQQERVGRWRPDARLRRLPSGDSVLALSLAEQQLLRTPEERQVDHCIEMVTILSRLLAQAGVHFVFSPIPESGTIYPELFDAVERDALPASSFIERLVDGVRQSGVEVVDLRPVYRSSRSPYLYLPDDSHWNARAADLAARAWADALGGLPQPGGLAATTTIRP